MKLEYTNEMVEGLLNNFGTTEYSPEAINKLRRVIELLGDEDLTFLISQVIVWARREGRTKIEEQDVLSAARKYEVHLFKNETIAKFDKEGAKISDINAILVYSLALKQLGSDKEDILIFESINSKIENGHKEVEKIDIQNAIRKIRGI